MQNLGISQAALNLRESITHGTKAKILELNKSLAQMIRSLT